MIQIILSALLLTAFLFYLYAAKSAWESLSGIIIFALFGSVMTFQFLWTDRPQWFMTAACVLEAALLAYYLLGLFRSNAKKKGPGREIIKGLKRRTGPYYELAVAARLMAQAKQGALMVIERRQKLDTWCVTGTMIDALLSKELIFSIFTPPGALHDGAVIIKGDRIAACGIIVPLSHNPEIPKELGTRHRAALGFSEATDGLCLVVSEESGAISVADRGSLYYDISFEKLPALLERAMRFRLQRKKNLLQTLEPHPGSAETVQV